MDNFIRNLLIKLMSTPQPLDARAPRIASIPQGGAPFGAVLPKTPPPSVPRISPAIPQTALPPVAWTAPKPSSIGPAGPRTTLPAQKHLTPSVSTAEEFRLGAPTQSVGAAPSRMAPKPVLSPTPQSNAFSQSSLDAPLAGGSQMFNIPEGTLDPTDLNEEPLNIPQQDLSSRGLPAGMMVAPNSIPSRMVPAGDQGSPDLISIIQKAIRKLR